MKEEFIAQIDEMMRLPGGEILNGLADELSEGNPVVGVRVNCRKGISVQQEREPVPWSNGAGFYVDGERPRFTMDPAIHQGLYYVQDPSSMVIADIVARLTKDAGSIVYIDACAAPGGKTTAAIDALPDGSLVVANEFDRRRFEILRENIQKWGYPGVVLSRGDTKRFAKLKAIADIIAADVPCSGEGMMRKDDDAVNQWSRSLVDNCASLQREIVSNLWPALKPGGYMIYSTCTFNIKENEENVRWILDTFGALPVDLHLSGDYGIVSAIGDTLPVGRFIPGRVKGEGLFVAVLQKPGDRFGSSDSIKDAEGFDILKSSDSVRLIPKRWAIVIRELERHLDVMLSGIEFARLKGRDFIPTQDYAMSLLYGTPLTEKFFKVAGEAEVDYPLAMAYLRGEALQIDAPKGIVLLKFGGRPLGFVKNLGNRANNLYPKEWQVRSTHIPDSPPSVVG